MIWRRMSADSDGSPNGDRRFGFRQSRVPGVEANLTTILRNFHKTRPLRPLLLPGYPSTTTLRVISRPQADKSVKSVFIPASTRMHDPPPQHTPHSALRYSIHIRNMSVPHSGPSSHYIAPNSFIYLSIRPCLLAFILSPGLIPSTFPTRCNSNPSRIIPSLFTFPVRSIRYHGTLHNFNSPGICCTRRSSQRAAPAACW
jgi:hypothetical protein